MGTMVKANQGTVMGILSHKARAQRRKRIVNEFQKIRDVGVVAKKFHVSVNTVYNALTESGHSVKNKPSRMRFRTYNIIADLINTNMTITEISKKRGCTHQFVSLVYQKAKDAGIPIDSRSDNWKGTKHAS